ncbi:MAG TPA: glycosyltransferase family 39 protein [Pirellulaceae bacterium]|nr:glycosyltransferase family 39 protein [Pirellulaceae bacterium]
MTHDRSLDRRRHGIGGLIVVLSTAAIVRVAMVAVWVERLDGTTFGFGDSVSYWQLAERLATGESYEFGWEGARCFRAPGYPFLLSLLFRLPGEPSVLAARGLGVAIGIGVVAAIYALAARFGGRRVAFVAGLLAALSPELGLSSGLVLAETTFDLLLVGQGLVWLGYRRATTDGVRWRSAALLGLLAALSVLVRPSWLPGIGLWTLGLLLVTGVRTDRREGLDRAAATPSAMSPSGPAFASRLTAAMLCVVVFSLTMSPWWVRNALLFGRFVPTTLQTGASLYDAWNPEADGGSDMSRIDAERLAFVRRSAAEWLDREEREAWFAQLPRHPQAEDYWPKIRSVVPRLWRRLQEEDHSLPPFEVAFDASLGNTARTWGAEHPERVAQLAGTKLLHLWSPWPRDGLGRSALVRWVWGGAWFVLLVGAVLGVRPIGRDRDAWILVAPALLVTLLHVVYVASIRYREPALPGLIIIAATGLASIGSRLTWGKGRAID